jgi:hypothetical protein
MTERQHKPRLLLVTGLSGAGKSTVLDALEDLGWDIVDNLPADLLDQFVHGKNQCRTAPVAIGMDVRSRGFDPASLPGLIRSMALVSSTTSATGTSSCASISTIPRPRTSSFPAICAGAEAMSRSSERRTTVWSSLTSVKPRSSSRSARSDLPDPEGPVMRTARPSIATVLAWIDSPESKGPFTIAPRSAGKV